MADEKKGFLEQAYGVEDSEATKRLYENWAETYDAEVRSYGYATPERCAEALAAHVEDRNAPLLDLGCGTGLSGEAFREAGFTTIDGTDFSQEMLDQARRKSGVYRKLTLGDLNNPIPAEPDEYSNIAAVGVFSPSHAPADMIETVMALLPQGGCFVFSLNDHALADPSYKERIDDLVSRGKAELVFEEYGDHLPKAGIKSSVCVLRKR